jgi:hypothetical protein
MQEQRTAIPMPAASDDATAAQQTTTPTAQQPTGGQQSTTPAAQQSTTPTPQQSATPAAQQTTTPTAQQGTTPTPQDTTRAPQDTTQTQQDTTRAQPEAGIWDPAQAEQLRQRWHEMQTRFVEDPEATVTEARQLLDEAVQSLTDNVHEREEQLARTGARGSDSTEGKRDAVLQYHRLLDRLLAV